MPYKIKKISGHSGGQFCVVKETDNSVVGCHPTQAKAKAHLSALYANVKDAKAGPTLMNRSMTFYRPVEFDRSKVSVEDRTVPVAFSSEHPVDRGDYDEVLDHSAEGLDMSRLNDSAAVLVNHNLDDQVGVVEKPELAGDKKGRALIRFGKSERASEIFTDIKDGIRKHLSVGYERIKVMANETKDGGRRCVRFAWRPFELSIVPVPADPTVGVGRSAATGSEVRSFTNMDVASLCQDALTDCNNALGAVEDCDGAEGTPHATAETALRDVIAALAIAKEDLNFWTDTTAAETVEVCAECATYCDEAVTALRAIASCPGCSRLCAEAIEELEEAAEGCRENAGIPAGDEKVAAEALVEAKLGEAAGDALMNEGENGGTTVDTRSKPEHASNSQTQNMSPAATSATTATSAAATTAPPDLTIVRGDAVTAERTRIVNIRKSTETIAGKHPDGAEQFRTLADTAISSGQTTEEFNAALLAAIPGVRKNPIMTAESLGMTPRDVNRYSLARAIQSILLSGRSVPDGIEGEVHQAMVKRTKESGTAVSASGFWVPPWTEMAAAPRGRRGFVRDLNVTTPGQGGAFVQTTIFTPIIEILRNRMVTQRLGVQSMAGLEGNIAIPRQTGAATAYSLPESATLTKSTQAIDQILLTPHRVGAYNEYSKQLLLQSSVDVENFIRDDLMKVLAIKWDRLILEGSGSGNEPTGILNTDAIGSVSFGGAPTWSKVVSFETALALANADLGNMAYVTTPGVRGSWKVTPKITGTSGVFPIFIWEKGEWGDGSNDGEVNDYRAAATNQISNNAVAFGNWEDAIHALWGGYDVVINPYSRDIDAVVRITVNTFGDVAVRHAASFAWSSDAGNQT